MNLFAGTVYAALKRLNIKFVSNIDKKYQKTTKIFKNNFSINSVKENIFITSVNTK
jgi:hypothetical protein